MRPRAIRLLCMLILFATTVMHAQFGVYGKFDLIHDSSGSAEGAAAFSDTFYGGGVGAYDDFLHLGPVRAGLDLRADFGSGGLYNYRAFLGGMRVAFKAPVLPIRPYVQASVGVGGTRTTGPLAAGISSVPYSRKLPYEFLGGVDWTLIPHLDLRAVEVGVGRQTGVSGGSSAPAATLVLVSSGVVLRF